MEKVKVRVELYNGKEKVLGVYDTRDEAWAAAKNAAMKEAGKNGRPLVIGRKTDEQVDVIYSGGAKKSIYALERVAGE